ncbi:hypothetical protein VTK73DRAFT_5964 [Phialemonium thermophilum]|uniref:Uncharacterized protein n=1 Tax=Phialemonium thermophilum TaxID=223376 RepID=A0ABR3V1G3_9PEZI
MADPADGDETAEAALHDAAAGSQAADRGHLGRAEDDLSRASVDQSRESSDQGGWDEDERAGAMAAHVYRQYFEKPLPSAAPPPMRKRGVGINEPHGWSGSLYDDYECVPPGANHRRSVMKAHPDPQRRHRPRHPRRLPHGLDRPRRRLVGAGPALRGHVRPRGRLLLRDRRRRHRLPAEGHHHAGRRAARGLRRGPREAGRGRSPAPVHVEPPVR